MTTTTQILFNSPALHSLKREQLVKLCKIHSIKASGKNVELIEKLKQHAQTLPRDSLLSIAARGEGPTPITENGLRDETKEMVVEKSASKVNDPVRGGSWSSQMPRPSEQWEVVMESIEEAMEDGSSQGSLSSLRTLGNNGGGSGEFGTGSSKSSSVGSSIKALASSLGFKRNNTKSTFVASSSSKSTLNQSTTNDELTQYSTPYAALPDADTLPQSDHFTFDPPALNSGKSMLEPPAPLPGHSLRPGVPAPDNARLSLGLGFGAPSTPTKSQQATTTIRLISNPHSRDNVADSYIGRTPQLKPFKTSFDLVTSPTSSGPGFGGGTLWPCDGTEEKKLYPPLPLETMQAPSVVASTKMDTDEDVFMPGSLANSPSRTAAPTRTSQLAVPVEPFIFGSPLPQHNVTNTQFKSAAASVLEEMNKRLKEDGIEGVGMDIINKLQPGAHANGVQMLGNRNQQALPKTNGVKEKFEKMHDVEFSKMEGIDKLVKRRGLSPDKGASERRESAIGKKRRSSVVGHGAGRDRYGRRIGGADSGRISITRVPGNGKKPRVIPGSFDEDSDNDEDGEEERDHYEPLNDVEERSDKTARVEPSAVKATTTTSVESEQKEEERKRKEKEAIRRKLEINRARRSSAGVAGARGRVSVGRGGILLKPQPKPSRFGFLSSAKSMVQSVWNRGKASATPATSIPKPAPKVEVAPQAQAPASKKVPSVGISRPSTAVSSGSRAPSLRVHKEAEKGTAPSRARSPIPSFGTKGSFMNGTKTSRLSSMSGTGASLKEKNITGVSSIGTRSSSTRLSSLGAGSMGSNKSIPVPGKLSSTSSRLSSSRLLAPTASSLAKATRLSTSNAGPKFVSKMGTSSIITDNSGMGKARPGGIFSKSPEMPSGIPTPVKKKPVDPLTDTANHIGTSNIGDTKPVGSGLNTVPNRQRSLNGRKPRISRSKVIAKLASQRAAGSGMSGKIGGTPIHTGRTRSSLGVKAQRSSLGGKGIGGTRGGTGSDVMMSAKKRARQSEYARRRSRVEPINLRTGTDRMDVDCDA